MDCFDLSRFAQFVCFQYGCVFRIHQHLTELRIC